MLCPVLKRTMQFRFKYISLENALPFTVRSLINIKGKNAVSYEHVFSIALSLNVNVISCLAFVT